MPRRQRGLGLLALLLCGALLVVVVAIGMKVLPSFLEYRAVQKAVEAASSVGTGASAAVEAQRSFERQAVIDNIVSVKATDLVIERLGNQLSVSVVYEKRVALFGPVSLLIEYEAKSGR